MSHLRIISTLATLGFALGVVVLVVFAQGYNPAAATGAVISHPETSVTAGTDPSLVLDSSGSPVVSYYDGGGGAGGNGDLKILHCGNPDCSTGNSITAPDGVDQVGAYSSLVLDANDRPIVSYWDQTNDDLKVIRCGNPNCTSGNSIAVPDADLVQGRTSLVLDALGYPVISYLGGQDTDLRVLHCENADCSSGNLNVVAAGVGGTGQQTSIALDSAGNPVVAYMDSFAGSLKLLHCGDPNCSGGNSVVTADSGGVLGSQLSLVLDAIGNPVVTYFDGLPNYRVKLIHCGDPNCTTGNSIASPDPEGGVFPSVGLDAVGNPVIAYSEWYGGGLRILHCGNVDCTLGNTISVADPSGGSYFTSIALDADGNSVVAYLNSGVKVIHCVDPNCQTLKPTPGAPTPTPTATPYASPVDITYHWKIDLAGGGTGSCDFVFDNQSGTTVQVDSTCLINQLSLRTLGSGTAEYNPANGVYRDLDTEGSDPCTSGSVVDGVVSQDGLTLSGSWECFSLATGTFTGSRQGDLDGIRDDFDPQPAVDSDDFVGPSTFGTIVDRGDQQVFVTNGLLPDEVQIVAVGSGSSATIEVCGDPMLTMELQDQARAAPRCGSATVQVVVGPVPAFFGTLAAMLPTGVTVHADELPSGCYDLTNDAASSDSVIVGGLTLNPGASATCVLDSDADGLVDGVETNTGTFVAPGDTGTDPNDPDVDADGLLDGVEILIRGTDPFDADSDDDGLLDGEEVHTQGTNPLNPDTDADGCSDGREVGPNEALGGRRNPLNPWDFYDVLGPGMALPTDGIIDLPNDILGVILHFSPTGAPPYDAHFDRGPWTGPNSWNMTAPDGVIDLPNDILGVILQFSHNCG